MQSGRTRGRPIRSGVGPSIVVLRPPHLELTLQVHCRGAAEELHSTLASIRRARDEAALMLEVQLISAALEPAGMERCTTACSDNQGLQIEWHPNSDAAAATRHARGRWIWPLEHGDQLHPNALNSWKEALIEHPAALMVAGNGEQIDHQGEVLRQHGAPPSQLRLRQLVAAQLYCPAALCWHRSLEVLVRHVEPAEPGIDRETWLLQVLEACPQRVVAVPELWAQTHQLSDWQQPGRCRRRALGLTSWLATRWGKAPGSELHRYGLQLQLGEALVPPGSTPLSELESALATAEQWLERDTHQQLLNGWGLNPELQPWQQRVEEALAAAGLGDLWCITLLRNLLHPELAALQLGSPWGPNIRLVERLLSLEIWGQYKLLRQDPELLRVLNQRIEGLPLIALLQWIQRPTWQQQFPLPQRSPSFMAWWQENAANACPQQRWSPEGQLEAEPFSEESATDPASRPFGVNLIGHAFEVFGIGEDVRMAALALKSAEVPFCVVNVPANNGASASDRSLDTQTLPPGELGPFRFNLVCLAAPSHGAWIASEGLAQQRGRTTIVAWPWETQTWPRAWECMIPLADAFWPSSKFTAKALKPYSDPARKPLQVMPMAVHIEEPGQYRNPRRRRATRERWGLGIEAKLILFVFDVKSSLARKNPWGAIEIFQRSFPPESGANVQLVIKALKPETNNAEWERLKHQLSQDSRQKLIADDLSRNDLLALIGCCDVFLSLHRSEGFGRGIAEAGILGLQVVTSAWGGNADFCQGSAFHLIACTPATISANQYPLAEGHTWGEPIPEVASTTLRQAITAANEYTNPSPSLEALSACSTGKRYRAWLEDRVNPLQQQCTG